MNSFSNFFQYLKKPFEESSGKYKNSVVKQLNYIYLCAYGFMQLDVSKSLKYTWRFCNLFSPVLMLVPMGTYYFILGQITIEDFITLQIGISASSMTIFTQLPIHFFSQRILGLLKILDEDPTAEFNNGTFLWEKNLTNKSIKFSTILRIYLFCIGIIMTSWILNFITILSQWEHFGAPELYFFPFPGVNRINSSAVFSFIYFAQCVILLTMQLSLLENLSFLDLLTKNMSNEFQILYQIIRANNEQFKIKVKLAYQMDRENQKYTDEELKSLFRWQRRERISLLCKKFNHNMIRCIRFHQKLVKKHAACKPIVEYIISFFIGIVFMGVVGVGYFASTVQNLEDLLGVYCIAFINLSYTMFYMNDIGERFLKMSEMIAEEVYSSPWYELPPKYRKDFYIFLTQVVQMDLQIYCLKIYPISMNFLPKIANTIYSYIINLRTIKSLRK